MALSFSSIARNKRRGDPTLSTRPVSLSSVFAILLTTRTGTSWRRAALPSCSWGAQVLMHDEKAARKSYEDFLALWKNADPDLSIYKEAKAEYAALRKTCAVAFPGGSTEQLRVCCISVRKGVSRLSSRPKPMQAWPKSHREARSSTQLPAIRFRLDNILIRHKGTDRNSRLFSVPVL